MKRYSLPPQFDGEKFSARYGLNAVAGDFFVDGDGMLCVPDNLPDDPPIFEAPDDDVTRARRTNNQELTNKIVLQAIVSTLIDELNILRAQHSLAPRTTSQAVAAIRNKINQYIQ